MESTPHETIHPERAPAKTRIEKMDGKEFEDNLARLRMLLEEKQRRAFDDPERTRKERERQQETEANPFFIKLKPGSARPAEFPGPTPAELAYEESKSVYRRKGGVELAVRERVQDDFDDEVRRVCEAFGLNIPSETPTYRVIEELRRAHEAMVKRGKDD